MSLEILWFVLIAFLWTGFFFLEGFDFGVSILQIFLGKNEKERGTYISSITPHWDGNEVWLLTAGGATFAAFPLWYATFFSALYLPLVLLLLALITRGACFEIRHRSTLVESRSLCDIALAISSFLAGLLTSVAMANLVTGIPVNSSGNFTGNILDLVHPYKLLGGLLGLSLFIANGTLFLTLKIEGELQERALKLSKPAIAICTILFAVASVLAWKHTAICLFPLALLLITTILVFMQHFKTAFAFIALCTACCVASLFIFMFPNVLVSSTSIDNNLNIWNAASSNYTLKIMSIVALIFIPITIAYQIWSYYIFRKRISPRNANIEV